MDSFGRVDRMFYCLYNIWINILKPMYPKIVPQMVFFTQVLIQAKRKFQIKLENSQNIMNFEVFEGILVDF